MIAPLERLPDNPLVSPSQIPFGNTTGAFNPGAAVDQTTGRVVLLVRVFDGETRRSSFALALSSDGRHIDEILDRPAVVPGARFEEWGVEDPRITWLEDEALYAITYTGYSGDGPRVCLITTDDLLAPEHYHRHGPRIAGENKNCVIFPEKLDEQYVILHRPLPRIVCVRVASLEDTWPENGVPLVGPRPGTWRSARVGAGAPPLRTRTGWLLPIHGATRVDEGNVYSMGWCVLDLKNPNRVLYVSDAPVLTPEAPYEIELGYVPQIDHANFKDGVRVVFPQGLVEQGDDLIVYYGAADVHVAGARVNKEDLLASIEEEIAAGRTGTPL
jgi:predicted GH43/DUF377 family glycosyl hydrolase